MWDTESPMNAPFERPFSAEADPDQELVNEARSAPEGDLRAFEELALRYQKRVVANCRFITRDPNNAEDLAQEVLVKVFFGLRSFERKSSFVHVVQHHRYGGLHARHSRRRVRIFLPFFL